MKELRDFIPNAPFAFLAPYFFPTPAVRLLPLARSCERNRKTPPANRRPWGELESPKEEEEGVQGREIQFAFIR